MKRMFIIALAILFCAGMAQAAVIPGAVSSTGNKEVWTTTVYVDETTATTVDAGNVVCWDIDDSTGDEFNWVENCDTETAPVAGVVWPADITGGQSGTIVIRGPVDVDMVTTGRANAVADATICASTTAGTAQTCSSDQAQAYRLGRALATAADGSVKVLVGY